MRIKSLRIFGVMLVMLLLSLIGAAATAQDVTNTPAATITFTGTVTEFTEAGFLVNGLEVTVDEASSPEIPVYIGAIVEVSGVLETNGTVTALSVTVVTISATPDAEVTPEPTPDPEDSDDEDNDAIIVIEGPVQSINVNIITIYSINIAVEEDDPILQEIEIGDIIRIEGELTDDDFGTILISNDESIDISIVAINITIINVDVYVNPDDPNQEWQDNGECANPPPPWAPAHGWRAKCEGGGARALPPGLKGRGRGK